MGPVSSASSGGSTTCARWSPTTAVRRDQLLRVYVRGQALRTVLLRGGAGGTGGRLVRQARCAPSSSSTVEVLLSTMRGPKGLLAGAATDRFLYAPGMRIVGGTSEIQRNIIAERVLGLPR